MTKADRDRGVITERKAAGYLRAHGFGNAERAVKTGMRTVDRAVADPGDITGTPALVWQVKALRPITRAEANVPGWMRETEAQRAAADADLGVLVVRRDQRDPAEWFAFVPLSDLYALRGLPGQLAELFDRAALVAIPARLYLGDLVTLLRSVGYGDPIVEPARPATGGPVLMTATP